MSYLCLDDSDGRERVPNADQIYDTDNVPCMTVYITIGSKTSPHHPIVTCHSFTII